jgi:hypothetical protein
MTYQYKSGINTTAAYQVSGLPWATGSVVDPAVSSWKLITFPAVTKAFTVFNMSSGSVLTNPLNVLFCTASTAYVNQALTAKHYIPINASGSFRFEVKCDHIVIATANQTASFFILAELTSIKGVDNMIILSGSGIDNTNGQ